MRLIEHDRRDAMKVWLSQEELDNLINEPDEQQRRIALALAGRCGLRSCEIIDVAPEHIHDTDIGTILRVHDGKGGKYREVPIPEKLTAEIRTADNYRPEPSSERILDVETTKALRDWIQKTREQLAERTGDEQWNNVSLHDLRRTWATAIASSDVDPFVVCDWGGWGNLETFLDAYRGTYSPEAQRREREKVDWL